MTLEILKTYIKYSYFKITYFKIKFGSKIKNLNRLHMVQRL